MSWEAQDVIALISVLASPLAALGGAWLNGYLTRKERASAHAEEMREETAAALGPMLGVLADAVPSLVTNAQLREYSTPDEAISGLYERWLRAREPLLVIHYSHHSERVRQLAFDLQATTELSLRTTADLVERGGSDADADARYRQAQAVAFELGQEIQAPQT